MTSRTAANVVAYKQIPAFRFRTPPKDRLDALDDAPIRSESSVAYGLKIKDPSVIPLAKKLARPSPERQRYGLAESSEQDDGFQDDIYFDRNNVRDDIIHVTEGGYGTSSSSTARPSRRGYDHFGKDILESRYTHADLEDTDCNAQAREDRGPQVSDEVLRLLSLAYDEEIGQVEKAVGDISGFRWTGVMDAAQAAWIGGTRLLRYGELLPSGTAEALSFLNDPDGGDTCNASAEGHLMLELGMGRGRAAMQLFLSGATVIGVELASERYGIAVAAIERLAHRCPQQFEIARQSADAVRIRRRGGAKGAIYEVRLGNFFEVVSDEELGAATRVIVQVCVPSPVWSQLRELLKRTHAGCRIMTYENLREVWEGAPDFTFRFEELGRLVLACSWAPQKGHQFYCYERPHASARESPFAVQA